MFEIRAFNLTSRFFGKAHKPLDQNKRSKNQLWVWCHCNICTLSGLCLFCNSNRTKSPFLISLTSFFSYVLPCFHQNLSNHFIIEQYPPCWSFKLAKSNQFKVDISPGQDWREMQISARSALFEKLNASLTTKHLENTHRFGRCSILNTLNLGKWGVRIHNCAVLLDFLALFGYTERILLFSRISPDNCLKTCSKACEMEWLCNDTSFRLTWKHAWEMAEKEKWGK